MVFKTTLLCLNNLSRTNVYNFMWNIWHNNPIMLQKVNSPIFNNYIIQDNAHKKGYKNAPKCTKLSHGPTTIHARFFGSFPFLYSLELLFILLEKDTVSKAGNVYLPVRDPDCASMLSSKNRNYPGRRHYHPPLHWLHKRKSGDPFPADSQQVRRKHLTKLMYYI